MKQSLRNSGKIQAFLIHLGISAGVVGLLVLLMLMQWYPQPWFSHDGGWHVFRLILLVDVVLGPTLTLVVFRRGNPSSNATFPSSSRCRWRRSPTARC